MEIQPEIKAPMIIRNGSLFPERRNAKQIPGNTEWDTTSPIKAFFFRNVKQPTVEAEIESKTDPNTTYFMLGYLKLKNSINRSIIGLGSGVAPFLVVHLPQLIKSVFHHRPLLIAFG